jgi:hypothetical protein
MRLQRSLAVEAGSRHSQRFYRRARREAVTTATFAPREGGGLVGCPPKYLAPLSPFPPQQAVTRKGKLPATEGRKANGSPRRWPGRRT